MQDVSLARVEVIDPHEPGVIYVPAAVRLGTIEVSGQFEVLQNAREIWFRGCNQAMLISSAVRQAPRVKSGKSFEFPRSAFDASLNGVTADHAAAS